MISKEKFVEAIDQIKDYCSMMTDLNAVFRAHNSDAEAYGHSIVDTCVTLLGNVMNVPDDDDTLVWWCWEEDYGKKFKIGDLVEADGTKPDLSTPELMYDYLLTCQS